jgi:hypothetical protein
MSLQLRFVIIKRRYKMVKKAPLCSNRIRKINGSFAFIEHRFLRYGFFSSLGHHELLLYFFLILAADRDGLSFYGYDKICSLLRISIDEYIQARNGLIENDLIAFDGYFYQVLSLPDKTSIPPGRLLKTRKEMEAHDPATIHQLIRHSLEENRG